MSLTDEVRDLREEVENLKTQLDCASPPKLLTTAQAAAFIGKSIDLLYEWRRDRKGPPYCHLSARSIVYDRDDLIAWVRDHKVG